jgi:cyclopropane-fatty-acyl-phospholipid synthase
MLLTPTRLHTPPPGHAPQGLAAWPRQVVLNLLQGMRKGRLTLTLPEGAQLTLGQEPESPFQATMTINREALFQKVLLNGQLGFAQAYLDGDWDTPDLEAVVAWFIYNMDESTILEGSQHKPFWLNALGVLDRLRHRLRANTAGKGSQRNIHEHYDLSNDFFRLFLDESMLYSSGYFLAPHVTLEAAQQEKLARLCRKLRLKPTDHVLEIGSGWGGFAIYAAQHFGCRVTTVTISRKQFEEAHRRIYAAGVADKVTLLYQDYRNIRGSFDKIVSIEMIEAVGDRYFEAFFAQCHRLLKPDGLLALQMITCPDSRYELLKNNVDFIQKYIFPGSLLPSLERVQQAMRKTGDLFLFELEDMGNHYVETLGRWHARFVEHLPEVKAQGFDSAFIRKWCYYLQYCRAAFRMRNITVVQAVYTRPNNLLLSEPVGG